MEDKELRESFKGFQIGIQDIKENMASFKAEVCAELKHGAKKFGEIREDIKDIKNNVGEIRVRLAEHRVTIRDQGRDIEQLKNQKWKDRLVSGATGAFTATIIFLTKWFSFDRG